LALDVGMKSARASVALVVLIFSGCSMLHRSGAIKAGPVTVQGVADAGKPATLATSNAGTVIPLPAGSIVTVTKESAIAATQAAPAVAAKETTAIVPAGPTEYRKTEETVKADTGTVDTSIAARRIDAEESRPLLYAAIAAALAGGFFVYRAYPTPALCCGAASVVFFMAWKVSGLPSWFWAVGLAAMAGGAALYLGHKRGLYEPVPTEKPTATPPSS